MLGLAQHLHAVGAVHLRQKLLAHFANAVVMRQRTTLVENYLTQRALHIVIGVLRVV